MDSEVISESIPDKKMNCTLTRLEYRADGVFSRLDLEDGTPFCVGLEHSYDLVPKVSVGTYTCRRRASPRFGYDVFEITNVPGHTFIEIHIGNFNEDSEGCVLIGEEIYLARTCQMITNSRETFDQFMALQEGVAEFLLIVK